MTGAQLAVWEYHAQHHRSCSWRACTHEHCRAALDDIDARDLPLLHTNYIAAIMRDPATGQQRMAM